MLKLVLISALSFAKNFKNTCKNLSLFLVVSMAEVGGVRSCDVFMYAASECPRDTQR